MFIHTHESVRDHVCPQMCSVCVYVCALRLNVSECCSHPACVGAFVCTGTTSECGVHVPVAPCILVVHPVPSWPSYAQCVPPGPE